METFDERKVKTLFVPKREMVSALIGSEYKNHITFNTLPDGYKVLDINFDYLRHGFYFAIWHESFQPLLEGEMMEEIDTVWHTVKEYVKEVE